MYDLGNKLAPVLQLGEEFAKSKPPSSTEAAAKSSGSGLGSGSGPESVKKQGSSVSTVSETTTDTRDISGGSDRKMSLKVDKTTPVL